MSKKLMDELLNSFHENGWVLLNPENKYEIEDEVIYWILKKEELQIILEFHIFGDLGRVSEDLNDILYCEAQGQSKKLFFERKKSLDWRRRIDEFNQEIVGVS